MAKYIIEILPLLKMEFLPICDTFYDGRNDYNTNFPILYRWFSVRIQSNHSRPCMYNFHLGMIMVFELTIPGMFRLSNLKRKKLIQ